MTFKPLRQFSEATILSWVASRLGSLPSVSLLPRHTLPVRFRLVPRLRYCIFPFHPGVYVLLNIHGIFSLRPSKPAGRCELSGIDNSALSSCLPTSSCHLQTAIENVAYHSIPFLLFVFFLMLIFSASLLHFLWHRSGDGSCGGSHVAKHLCSRISTKAGTATKATETYDGITRRFSRIDYRPVQCPPGLSP
jgi:hypothetical protein